MNSTFVINGGAGRVVTAIPALEKYHRLNPTDDFKVLVHGWADLLWSHPILQNCSFEANQKGTFDTHIKNNYTITPEPYTLHSFYNQKKNLIEAFDEIINKTNDHTDLNLPNIHLSQYEIQQTKDIFNKIKLDNPGKKVVIFQPYGSSVDFLNNSPFDQSNRSLSVDHYLQISKKLQDVAVIIYASPKRFMTSDDINIPINNWNPYFRVLPAFIKEADYFIGVDSCAQHIAYGMKKPGTVIMGGTVNNYTYPDFFKVIRKQGHNPVYNPIRLSMGDNDFADRSNSEIMNFSNKDIEDISKFLIKEIINIKN